MNKLIRYFLALALFPIVSYGQTSLNATTLGAAVAALNQRTIQLVSATGVVAPSPLGAAGSVLFVDQEALTVTSVSGNYVTVTRGSQGTAASAHVTGAMVLFGPANAFIATPFDPSGACTAGVGIFLYSPVVNIRTGNEWLCSTITGKVIPGFSNSAGIPQVSTAVASAAGLITPSGPLFHVTGALAVTGFNLPIGFDPKEGGSFCTIPDGAYTTTTANNIAITSTAVVGRPLCFTYDTNTARFYPSY